jgi:hypothetical protein
VFVIRLARTKRNHQKVSRVKESKVRSLKNYHNSIWNSAGITSILTLNGIANMLTSYSRILWKRELKLLLKKLKFSIYSIALVALPISVMWSVSYCLIAVPVRTIQAASRTLLSRQTFVNKKIHSLQTDVHFIHVLSDVSANSKSYTESIKLKKTFPLHSISNSVSDFNSYRTSKHERIPYSREHPHTRIPYSVNKTQYCRWFHSFLAYFPYFEKIKIGVLDHIAVYMCVSLSLCLYVYPSTAFERLNRHLWNLVRIVMPAEPSQWRTS